MCGVSGIIGPYARRDTLDLMLEVQKHRGPDAIGRFIDDQVCLGHNRLSIIDLSKNANQPFYSSDDRYVLVFNGEIYNYLELKAILKDDYSFKTTSDTEVLLASYLVWGERCLHRLNGMFSFAIWDRQKQLLFVARDRFGVKPFYYSNSEKGFFFGSEIKALFSAGIPKVPNEKVWATYFAYGSYGLPTETFWQNVEQLAGGYYLMYQKGKLTTRKWYFFEEEVKKHESDSSYIEVKNNYKNLLEDSINLRFRSEVPIGFNVSGGLDSSALLALVNQREDGGNIQAYTFYTGDKRYDELPWVEGLLKITGNPLHKVRLEASQVVSLSKEMALFQDEPYGGIPTLAYAEIFKNARKDGVYVLLDGQGMDEQWAGYDYYINKSGGTIQGITKSPFRLKVLKEEFFQKAEKPEYPKLFESDLLNLQYRDLFYTKIPRALRFNDRVSMASSTELREPFLDYRLVEFAFAQPKCYKIKEGIQKYVLRDLVSDYIPNEISFAPKRALQTPQREWLAQDLKDWVVEVVERLEGTGWFDTTALSNEVENYINGDQESSFHIWQWINASLMLQRDMI